MLLLITFIWGATFTLSKGALRHVPVYPFLTVRFLLAAVSLTVIYLISGRSRRHQTRRLWQAGGIIGLSLFGGYALQTLGLLTASAATAGFLTGLSVVLVPILGIVLLRRRSRARTWGGALLAAAGLALVSGGNLGSPLRGDLLLLGCALCLALQIVLTEKLGRGMDTLGLACVELWVVALCSLAVSLLQAQGPAVWSYAAWSGPSVVWALLVNGLLGTSFAYWGQNVGQQFASASEVAVIFTMEPVFAALIAWCFAGESMSAISVGGGILIVLSMLVADPGLPIPLPLRRHMP